MASLGLLAEIAVVVIVAVLVESFLVVPVMALVHVVLVLLVLLVVWVVLLMRPETEVALVLKWSREVNRCQRGVERLRLWGGEGVSVIIGLAAPRLESTLAVEVPGGVGRVWTTLEGQVQGAEDVALVLALEEVGQDVVRLVSVPDLSRLFRQQVRLVERCLEVEADVGLCPLLGFLGLLHRIRNLQVVEVEVALGCVVDAVHH